MHRCFSTSLAAMATAAVLCLFTWTSPAMASGPNVDSCDKVTVTVKCYVCSSKKVLGSFTKAGSTRGNSNCFGDGAYIVNTKDQCVSKYHRSDVGYEASYKQNGKKETMNYGCD